MPKRQYSKIELPFYFDGTFVDDKPCTGYIHCLIGPVIERADGEQIALFYMGQISNGAPDGLGKLHVVGIDEAKLDRYLHGYFVGGEFDHANPCTNMTPSEALEIGSILFRNSEDLRTDIDTINAAEHACLFTEIIQLSLTHGSDLFKAGKRLATTRQIEPTERELIQANVRQMLLFRPVPTNMYEADALRLQVAAARAKDNLATAVASTSSSAISTNATLTAMPSMGAMPLEDNFEPPKLDDAIQFAAECFPRP